MSALSIRLAESIEELYTSPGNHPDTQAAASNFITTRNRGKRAVARANSGGKRKIAAKK
jgi:hypothetical protein